MINLLGTAVFFLCVAMIVPCLVLIGLIVKLLDFIDDRGKNRARRKHEVERSHYE